MRDLKGRSNRYGVLSAAVTLAFAAVFFNGTACAANVGGDPNALLSGEEDEGFVSIFDGKTLKGWTIDRSARPMSFTVRNNAIFCTGGADYEALLRTEKMYENFDLRLEYQVPGWSESGVLFHVPPVGRATRMGVKIQIYHRIGDGHHEPNFSGSIFGVRSPEKDLAKGSNDWQTMRILMDWPTLKVWLNGELIHDLNCDEIEALKYRERSGYIALQDIQSDCFFRRIRIRELPSKEKWEVLFNGKDFTGWHEADHAQWDVRMPVSGERVWACPDHPDNRLLEFDKCPVCQKDMTVVPAGNVWTCAMHPQIRQPKSGKCPICSMNLVPVSTTEDAAKVKPLAGKIAPGVIHAEKSTGYLITDKRYKDFELRMVIRESPNANGGVFFRWTREDKGGDRGYEIQIRNSPDASHPTGSIYKYDRAWDDEIVKGSEWYVMKIIAVGPHIQVWIDGKKVSEIKDAEITNAGQISLQMHSNNSWVEWKDIRVKDLSK